MGKGRSEPVGASLSITWEELPKRMKLKRRSRRSQKRHTAAERGRLFRSRDLHPTEIQMRLRTAETEEWGVGVKRHSKMNWADTFYFSEAWNVNSSSES